LYYSGLEWGPVAGFCDHGIELLGSVKDGECLNQPTVCYLFKKNSAPWS